MKKGVDYPGVTIAFFCHDGKGNYLFQKRGANCRDEQGKWDVGAGGLDLGETAEETLRKEVKEEYGADIISFEFLGYHDAMRTHEGVPTHWLVLVFKVLVDPAQVVNGEPQKFDEIGWYRLDNPPQPVHSMLPGSLVKYGDRL